ncbi:MAG: hypothetical protein ABIG46_00725 [Candidatus Omnitrophota bacterium]|nr:hypothetical protein [Candidatus Omnitrophota bacterium]
MFTYFHLNKPSSLNNNRGQLASIFIAIIAVMIIMAIATVNLGKVAFIKTESSNAVDAGSLAAGSAMANNFNSVTVSSAKMHKDYWEFYLQTTLNFAIATYRLVEAYTAVQSALSSSVQAKAQAMQAITQATSASGQVASFATACKASLPAGQALQRTSQAISSLIKAINSITKSLTAMGKFQDTMRSIDLSITSFWVAQNYTYLNIRKGLKKGWENAIKAGYGSAFSNSGIGGKLTKEQQEDFGDFSENIGTAPSYTYSWVDGQGRSHSVKVDVGIMDVNSLQVKVATLPFPAIAALLAGIFVTANSAVASLGIGQQSYVQAGRSFVEAGSEYSGSLGPIAQACANTVCCPPKYMCNTCPPFFAAAAQAAAILTKGNAASTQGIASIVMGDTALVSASTSMILIFPMIIATLAGLLAGPEITDDNGDIWLYITCWITDINHDRLVKVDITQNHEGADLGGMWETKYPTTTGFSIVNFQGNGDIGGFVPKHDATIIETDQL